MNSFMRCPKSPYSPHIYIYMIFFKEKSIMAPKYVLNYFNLQGRGEIARLLFHCKGVEFTDNKISFQDWPALKNDSKILLIIVNKKFS